MLGIIYNILYIILYIIHKVPNERLSSPHSLSWKKICICSVKCLSGHNMLVTKAIYYKTSGTFFKNFFLVI